jgi:hypothetical protein
VLLLASAVVLEVVSVAGELLGYVLLELEVSAGVVSLVLGDVDMPYEEPVALEVELVAPVELVVSVELKLEPGLVAAVVFRLPLVFSFVVLGLELELVVPKVESVLDDVVESVVLLDGEL